MNELQQALQLLQDYQRERGQQTKAPSALPRGWEISEPLPNTFGWSLKADTTYAGERETKAQEIRMFMAEREAEAFRARQKRRLLADVAGILADNRSS